jgi:hypothetical protein
MITCELLEGARQLAAQRGLPVGEVTCPTEEVCDGEYCIYLSDDEVDSVEIEKFYARLEKHFALKGVIFERTTDN